MAQEGRKVGSLKRRVRSQLATGAMKKLHAVVARSTFPSQNVQNTRGSDHFWKLRCRKSARRLWREAHFQVKMYKTPQRRTTFGKLRCRKSARRCGTKHISKSKCTKHLSVGPLLEVEMSKKCNAIVARSTFPSQNVQNTSASDHFWKLRCRKSARRCGAKHISKSKCTKTHHSRTTFGS